jgi:hypothetical protein
VYYLVLLAKYAPTRVGDVLKWWLAVIGNMAIQNPAAKVLFAKNFMYTYRGSTDWFKCMNESTNMILEAAAQAPYVPPSSRVQDGVLSRRQQQAAKRQLDAANAATLQNKRHKPVVNKRTAQGGQGTGLQCCFTRSDPAMGDCTYTKCRFSHNCATCGADHSAMDCPSFDMKFLRVKPP